MRRVLSTATVFIRSTDAARTKDLHRVLARQGTACIRTCANRSNAVLCRRNERATPALLVSATQTVFPQSAQALWNTVPYADRSTVAIHCGQPYNGPSAVISAGVRQRRTECTASHPCKATLPQYSQYSLWVNRDHCAQCSVHATVEFHSICCRHSSWILTVHTCTLESPKC